MQRDRLCLFVLCLAPALLAAEEEPEFTDEFPLDRCQFVPWGGNDYFSLTPGRRTLFSNAACVAAGDCDEQEELVITVTRDVKRIPLEIDGRNRSIYARVIEEYETADGEVAEISRNFFAMCWPSKDVYYFGEEVDIYEDGEVVSHDGAWIAGRDGAAPGLIMPESGFLVGARYYQEIASGIALDRAEHVGADLRVDVGAGSFDECIEVEETSPLEPGSTSDKVYCRGAGLVIDDDLEATAVEYAAKRDWDEDD